MILYDSANKSEKKMDKTINTQAKREHLRKGVMGGGVQCSVTAQTRAQNRPRGGENIMFLHWIGMEEGGVVLWCGAGHWC